MREYKTLLLLMLFSMLIIAPACEKEAVDPDPCYALSIKKDAEVMVLTEPYTVDAGRSIEFKNCGRADFYAFFDGTPGHIWSEFNDPSDVSTVGADTKSGGDLDYTYLTPGQYTATIVLTNRQVGDPHHSSQVTLDFVITVTEPEE